MRFQLLAAIAALVVGCAVPPSAQPTLFERIGGERVLRQVVAETVDRTSSDPRTAHHFRQVKLARVKQMLYEQLCELSAGPCRYSGDPMVEVHKGLHNTESDFYLLVQFLRDSLDHAGVGLREKNELLRLLAPLKREIVHG